MIKKILNSIKKDWFIIAVLVVTFIVSLYFYASLPSQIPIHWNAKGQVDGYSGKLFGTFAMPLMNLAFYFFFIVLPFLDPKKANYAKFQSAYKLIRITFHIFFAGIQAIVLLVALGHTVNVSMFVGLGTSLLFVVIGNVMGKFKHNYFVGIKTPWTLANEEVWAKTHRMAAPLWVVGGIISAIFAIVGGESFFIALFIILSIVSIVPIIYSYIIFKKFDKKIVE
ncbi:SdpI family protein [Clostridium vincentii]|uniref:Immunity protein SdpI n=1 Tax=Clostridium vincentii TaxID=52704 RepID=A0A2T0B776_9CLOT|nr:SdpI family protein [Clostridium vincentii]PRR79741.1 Immunity protein SdpI [Clostridium vincentii]